MALADVLLLICVALSVVMLSVADTFDVTQFGAVGDGRTDDSQAFQKAWSATCTSRSNPTLNVPGGKTFFLNPLTFGGPCASSVTLQIDGGIVAPASKEAWNNCDDNTWIVFRGVNSLIVQGTGSIDGRGQPWFNERAHNPPQGQCFKPTALRFVSCDSSQLNGIQLVNSGGRHFAITSSNGVSVNKITIQVPGNSRNTDGINIAGSRNVQIRDSNIASGDDCIAINNNVSNVNISGITCGPGHGISVGSLGKGGEAVSVDGIFVEHCSFTNTEASARIKTWAAGSGFAKNIFFEHLTLDGVESAIEINQNYFEVESQQNGGVLVSGVHFTDVRGSGEKILLNCNAQSPCQGIVIKEVNLAPSTSKPVEVVCTHADVQASNNNPQITCSN